MIKDDKMRTIMKILLGVLIVLIVIQFIKPARNISTQVQTGDISKHVTVPDTVYNILKRSCYDCHSNNTKYPWYANVQPVAWYLAQHVNEGKRELNFNEFASFTAKRQIRKMDELAETVKEGEMPIPSYTWIHKDAKLSEQDKKLLIDWSTQIKDSISRANPGAQK